MMKKLLLFFMLLAMAVPLWAGERTVTISRNEGIYDDGNGVYYCSKGGITMTFSSGLNNVNYLVEHQQVVFDIFSTNYVIKKIKFNCLDNTTNNNLDCFYWGPSTIHECTRSPYVPTGSYTYSGYVGTWTGGSTPSKYVKFETEGKPVRFGSVEITYDKEFGDIYDLVTNTGQLKVDSTYVLVSQRDSRALGKEEYHTDDSYTTFSSTPVTLMDRHQDNLYWKVKITDEVQLIKLQQSTSTNRPWLLKVGDNYIRRRNGQFTSGSGTNQGYNLFSVATLPTNESDLYNFRVSISFGTASNALISYYHGSGDTFASGRSLAIRHYNGGDLFRVMDWSSANSDAIYQRVYLYKPSNPYIITKECKPNATDGYISLSDGVLLDNQGRETSQYGDYVSFFVGPTDGRGIGDVTVTNLATNEVTTLTPTATSDFGNDYSFAMPNADVHIVAHFTMPHNINTVVNPTGGGEFNFINGYTDFNGQTMSNAGKSVTFSVNPADGYEFNSLTYTDGVTGETTTLTPDANGVFTFVMPDNDVTLTANFDEIPYYSISTVCTPPEGGSITITGGMNENNMAQAGETVTLDVGTNWGWTISEVVVINTTTGETTTITPVATTDAGNSYSFVMPSGDVTVEARFDVSMPSLYLLGTAMGRTSWVPAGPRFNYNYTTEEYYLQVYYKGGNDDVNSDQAFGYFSLAKDIDHDITWQTDTDGDWSKVKGRLAAESNNYGVDDGSSNVVLYGDRPDNAFKIPAGVYTIYVNKDMNRMRIVETPLSLTFDPVSGSSVDLGQVVTISSDLQTIVHGIAQQYSINEEPQSFKNTTDNWTTQEADNTAVLNQLGTTTVKAEANIDYIVVPGEAVYTIVPVSYTIDAIWSPENAGTVTVAPSANEGQTVTVTVAANSGYSLTSMTVTNSDTGASISYTNNGDGTYTFTMPANNVVIMANFSLIQYGIFTSCTPPEGGSIDCDVSTSVPGEDVTFTVETNPGYVLQSVTMTVDGQATTITPDGNGVYSFEMPNDNVYITANFELAAYNITTVCDPVGAGEFSQVASTSSAGEPVAFTVTPNLGYQLSEVTVTADGTTTTLTPDENGNYSFNMPTADVTVTAHFTPVGVVLRQVMRNSEIVEGKTYAYVTQEYDKSLGYDNDFVSLDIIQWVTPDKYKVKVDGRTVFFRLEQVADTTYGNNCLVAYLKTPLGYLGIEEITAGVNHFQIYPTVHYNFSRNILRIDEDLSSVLWSHYSGCPSGLSYDNEINQFNYSKGRENVWLYKVAESYNVSTACDPVNSGAIDLIDGVTGTTALDGDTVTVRPVAADGYVFDHLIVTVDGTTQIVEPIDNHDGTFSFVMPVGDVTVTGYFVTAHYITTVCDPEGAGDIIVVSAAGAGHVVPFNVVPTEGYALGSLEIKDSNGQVITPQYDSNEGGYSFEMPGADVTITAHFVTGYHVTTRVLPVLPDGEVCGELNAYWLDHPDVVDYFAPGTPVTADLWINKHYVMDSVVLTYGDVVYRLPMEYDGDNYCASTFDMPESDVIVTAYLRFSTPLSYIETPGNFEYEDPVTVTDTLIGAWAARYYLWAKDQTPYVSNDFVEIPEGQTDYVRRNLKLQIHDWDQSNWVMLDFSNLINGNTDNGDPWPTAEEWTRIQDLVDHRIEPSSIHGTYVYDLSTVDGDDFAVESHHKCRIILDAWPDPIDPYSHESLGYPGYVQDPLELPAPDGYYEDPTTYRYNHYTPANFLRDNIGGSHGGVGSAGVVPGQAANPDYDTSVSFFFMNPKDQEIAQVWAVWLGKMTFWGQCSDQEITADVFEVFKPYPEGNPTVNGYDLSGAFYVPSWDFNRLSPDHNNTSAYGQPSGDNELIPNTAYQFHVAIMTRNEVSEVNKKAPKREDAAAPEATKTEPWDFYEVYPLDLQSHSTNYTAVQEIMPREASQIDSILYYNVMGQESRTPFDGINIEVIRYKDRSSISRKILR